MAKPTLPPEPPENLVLVPLRAIRGTLDDHTRRFDVMTADVLAFTVAFGVLASFVVGGFVLLFTEMRALNRKFDELRRDLAEEFRAQRAEVLAQTGALAAAITAART
jgi:hypothetical protein